MMKVTISAAMAYVAAGKTFDLNAFVLCTTAASCLEASFNSFPVPMKKNIVIDCEKRPRTDVARAMRMCWATWPGDARKPITPVARRPAIVSSVVMSRNCAMRGAMIDSPADERQGRRPHQLS